MAHRPIRVVPAAALQEGFEAIRREAHVPTAFPPEVEAEVRAVGAPRTGDRVDVPFVTVDPPGSRDLDQALHIERRGDGHRVRYAIADVAAFVAPGGPLDAETHARGVTVYAPDAKTPLHPLALSEGVASLLPGQWTPAVLWTLDLDGAGNLVSTDVARAEVRSVAQHTYADVPAPVAELLAEVGERRLALEIARGGVQLEIPEQEVVREDGSWTVRYRVPLATEDHNAQISLLTGMAAAQLMLRAGTGILRTQPPPDERSLERLRRQAHALGASWPRSMSYPDFVRSLDPTLPAHAALMHEAAGVGRGRRLHRVRRRAARGVLALRDRGRIRPRDRAAAPPAGPLRLRVLPRRVGGHADPRLGPRRARRAARRHDGSGAARRDRRARGGRPRRGGAALRPRGRRLPGGRRRREARAARRARGARASSTAMRPRRATT